MTLCSGGKRLEERSENRVICSRNWKREANNFKLKLKWQFILEQPLGALVPGLWNSDQGRLMGLASCEIIPLRDWVLPGSWGAAFGTIQMWVPTMGRRAQPRPHGKSGRVWHPLSIGAPSERVTWADGIVRGLIPCHFSRGLQ